KAAYVDASVRLTDTLSVSGGVRYNKDDKDFLVVQNQTVVTGQAFIAAGSRLDGSWSSTTPRGSMEFKPNEDLLLYGSVSKGFKSGGINSFIFSPGDLKTYDPGEQ